MSNINVENEELENLVLQRNLENWIKYLTDKQLESLEGLEHAMNENDKLAKDITEFVEKEYENIKEEYANHLRLNGQMLADEEYVDNKLYRELGMVSQRYVEPEKPKMVFNLDDLSDERCIELFYFNKAEIKRLISALRIPESPMIVHPHKCYRTKPDELICIILMRIVSNYDFKAFCPVFHRKSLSTFSDIINDTFDYLVKRYSHLLHVDGVGYSNGDKKLFSSEKLRFYNQTVAKKLDQLQSELKLDFNVMDSDIAYSLQNCVGFIEKSSIEIRRPNSLVETEYQDREDPTRACINIHAVVMPDGLISYLNCKLPGSYDVVEEFNKEGSELSRLLENSFVRDDGGVYTLFGDRNYNVSKSKFVVSPGKIVANQNIPELGLQIPKEKLQKLSAVTKRLRTVNKWYFHNFHETFKYCTSTTLRIRAQNVTDIIFCSFLFANIRSCLRCPSPRKSKYFGITPPSVEEYLSVPDT
ncbi:unnamed protein product [Ambrosiozyma monospora]|uniref:Unnamed protein product n=1 Tax=Ambrosiozyma monospora TaxID=43982 RepID=A0A9W6YZZ2_AMBMO|nr:unnamed protein product [Ambrosiozyma monospora]